MLYRWKQWDRLPPPPVRNFTIATLRGQLLVVGGEGKYRKSNKIHTFDEQLKQLPWVQTYPPMPSELAVPAAIGYHDHLIVAGGMSYWNYSYWMNDFNILDTASNKWQTAQPLPRAGYYNTVLIHDILYLVGQDTQTILRAHMPTLISGTKSGVGETL